MGSTPARRAKFYSIMFPIGDSIKSKSFPTVTYALIAINVFVFIQEIISANGHKFIDQYALIPQNINIGNLNTFLPFLTALFLHGGFIHIISNMWFLFIFGDDVEDALGKFKFLFLYLLAGIGGNVTQYLLSPSSAIPILGASGAISGIMGAYYVLFPQSKIKTLIFIFFFVTFMEVPAVIYLIYWFVIQLFSGASTIGGTGGGVAFWAHVAGFATGIYVARIYKNKNNKNYIEGEIVG